MKQSGSTYFDGFMQLDKDDWDSMQITNKIPSNKKYVLTADDNWVKNEMKKIRSERISKEKMKSFEPPAVENEEELAQ